MKPRFDYFEGPFDEIRYGILRTNLIIESRKKGPIRRGDEEHFPIDEEISVVLNENGVSMGATVISYSVFFNGRFGKVFNQAGLRRADQPSNSLEEKAGENGDLMVHPCPNDISEAQ